MYHAGYMVCHNDFLFGLSKIVLKVYAHQYLSVKTGHLLVLKDGVKRNMFKGRNGCFWSKLESQIFYWKQKHSIVKLKLLMLKIIDL